MSRFFYKFPVKRSQDFLGSILNYSFFILGLEINDAIYPKNIAAAIPPADAVIPPVNAPIIPDSLLRLLQDYIQNQLMVLLHRHQQNQQDIDKFQVLPK